MFKIPSLKKSQTLANFLSEYAQMLRTQMGPQKLKEWAESSGIGSRSNFKNFITGRRKLPSHVQKKMARVLDMDAESQNLLSNPENLSQMGSKEVDKYHVSEDFFADPINTIVLNLCGIRAKMDEAQLEKILGGLFNSVQIKTCVQTLLDLKLVRRQDDSSLVRVFEGRITTLPGKKSDFSRQYFKSSYAMADIAWNFPLHIRETGAFTFRIESVNIPKMKELIRSFRNDLCALGAPHGKSDSVYQCVVSAFPIYLEEEKNIDSNIPL